MFNDLPTPSSQRMRVPSALEDLLRTAMQALRHRHAAEAQELDKQAAEALAASGQAEAGDSKSS
jgi:hypothetical protein